jgi:hypothetical protein
MWKILNTHFLVWAFHRTFYKKLATYTPAWSTHFPSEFFCDCAQLIGFDVHLLQTQTYFCHTNCTTLKLRRKVKSFVCISLSIPCTESVTHNPHKSRLSLYLMLYCLYSGLYLIGSELHTRTGMGPYWTDKMCEGEGVCIQTTQVFPGSTAIAQPILNFATKWR